MWMNFWADDDPLVQTHDHQLALCSSFQDMTIVSIGCRNAFNVPNPWRLKGRLRRRRGGGRGGFPDLPGRIVPPPQYQYKQKYKDHNSQHSNCRQIHRYDGWFVW